MKSLLVLPAMPNDAPFLKCYVDWYVDNGCDFDVVCLNRKLSPVDDFPPNYHFYDQKINYEDKIVTRFVKNYRFYRYVKTMMKQTDYERVILFSLPTLVFFSNFLVRYFKKKYIIDIRDYSSVYKIKFCRYLINKALRNSFANCISSEGFKSWLPKDLNYTISHNVGKDLLSLAEYKDIELTPPLNILTIGLIRDADANNDVLNRLSNNPLFKLSFVGDGPAMNAIKENALKENIQNVMFYGRYEKAEEYDIVKKYDIINNYMPNNLLSNSLMSNRFYLSVLYGKPMIVRTGSVQASFVRKNNLGIIVDSNDDLGMKLLEFSRAFNSQAFNEGRVRFLREVRTDISLFESMLSVFIDKSVNILSQ